MKNALLVPMLLLVSQSAGWAETRFQVPDTRLIFEESGLADRIISEEKGIITFDCGARPEDGQVCTFEPATGRIVDRIPLKLVRIPDHDTKKYEGMESAENVYYASYPCGVTMESSAHRAHGSAFVYSYLLGVQPGSSRSVRDVLFPTNEFLEVLEPEGVRLIPMRGSSFKSGWFFYSSSGSDPWYFRRDGKVVKMDGVDVGMFGEMKNTLHPGDEFPFQMTASVPPGSIEAFAGCAWMADSGNKVPFASNVSEGLSTIFGEYMPGLVVGPRRDLKGLSPVARARKLLEELERFQEAGWVDETTSSEIGEGLRAIAQAEGKPERLKQQVKELIEKVSGMEAERCSVECRSILTVNLDIAARDLAASREGSSRPAR